MHLQIVVGILGMSESGDNYCWQKQETKKDSHF